MLKSQDQILLVRLGFDLHPGGEVPGFGTWQALVNPTALFAASLKRFCLSSLAVFTGMINNLYNSDII